MTSVDPDQYLHTFSKTPEIHQPLPSRGLVASLGYLGDISLVHYMPGHVVVQSLCC